MSAAITSGKEQKRAMGILKYSPARRLMGTKARRPEPVIRLPAPMPASGAVSATAFQTNSAAMEQSRLRQEKRARAPTLEETLVVVLGTIKARCSVIQTARSILHNAATLILMNPCYPVQVQWI